VSGISCHRCEIDRESSQLITAGNIQLEAKLRPSDGICEVFLLLPSRLILRLSLGVVKENIDGQHPSIIPMRRGTQAASLAAPAPETKKFVALPF
jgi:hypothetical protein